MNEVTKVHLARQAFTISVDAYHELKTYIEAISKQVKDQDVVEEIELRMAELLTERGVNASKVILPGDVDYLKTQLGDPADFTEDDSETESTPTDTKRLFRDTDNAMVAGVAAGLAKYFGLDILLVRLLFVLLVLITFGWGILLYILLWLLVPEAKTSSERLQMAGKPVTVKSLKAVVEQADVKGTAKRVNNTLAGTINAIFSLILKIVGVAFAIFGLSTLFGLIAGETYFLAHGDNWAQNNIFPIGLRQHILFDVALAVAALISVFIIIFGIAIFRRKWPIKTWVTGVLAGLVLIGFATGGALTADVYPDVRNAYNANLHTTIRTMQPFSSLSFQDFDMYNVNLVSSDKYMVALNYYDHPNLANVKTSVNNGTLVIDASNFKWRRDCDTLCFPITYRLSITVYAPNADQLGNKPLPTPFMLPKLQNWDAKPLFQ